MAKIKKADTTTRKVEVEYLLSLNDTFEVYISALKAAGRSKRTIAVYEQSFMVYMPYFSDRGLTVFGDLNTNVIRELLAWWADEGHDRGGCHMLYRNLKAYLNWVWNEYDIKVRNPIEKVKCAARRPVPIPGFTMDEVDALINAAKAGRFPQRDVAMIYLFVDTGLRRQELCDLRFRDVDLNSGRITVECGKGGKFRFVYCGNECRKMLRRYAACIEDVTPDDFFFLSDEGFPLTVSGVVSILRRLEKRAGFERYKGFHGMRRCFALERLRNGDDIYTIQRALGHSSPVVTQRYLACTSEDDIAAAVHSSPMDNHRRKQRR